MGRRKLIVLVALLVALAGGAVWLGMGGMYWAMAVVVAVMLFLVYRIIALYDSNMRKLNYLLGAFESGDLHVLPDDYHYNIDVAF